MAEYDKKAVLQPSSAPTVEDCIEAKGDRKELLRLSAQATKTLAYMNTQKARLLSFEDALEPRRDMLLSRAVSEANTSGYTYHDLRMAEARQSKQYQTANRDLIRTRSRRRMVESVIRNMEQLLNQIDRTLSN